MGKGTITAETGAGLYTVEQKLDQTRATAALTTITTNLTTLTNTTIPGAVAAVNAQVAFVNTKLVALNAAIATNNEEQIRLATKEVNEAKDVLTGANRRLTSLKLEHASLTRRKAWLEAQIQTNPTGAIWCADYTEGLTGDRGLIYPDNDPKNTPIIAPATATGNANAYSAATHGIHQPVVSSLPITAWYNAALMPAWQRNIAPTYRLATITSIDPGQNEANVTLLPATSRYQDIDLNPDVTTLTGVPISYLSCNAEAFAVDDVVLVEYQGNDLTNPRIIGFRDNPRPCSLPVLFITAEYQFGVPNGERLKRWTWNGSSMNLLTTSPFGMMSIYCGGWWGMADPSDDNVILQGPNSESFSHNVPGFYEGWNERDWNGGFFFVNSRHYAFIRAVDSSGTPAGFKDNLKVTIYNRSDSSLAYDYTFDLDDWTPATQQYHWYEGQVRINETRIMISAQCIGNTDAENRIAVVLIDITDGTLVAQLDDYAMSFVGGTLPDSPEIALSTDRAYSKGQAYDLAGNSKGATPFTPWDNGQGYESQPNGMQTFAATDDRIGLMDGWFRDFNDDDAGTYAVKEYSITKGGTGVDDTYTLERTFTWNRGQDDYVNEFLSTDFAML